MIISKPGSKPVCCFLYKPPLEVKLSDLILFFPASVVPTNCPVISSGTSFWLDLAVPYIRNPETDAAPCYVISTFVRGLASCSLCTPQISHHCGQHRMRPSTPYIFITVYPQLHFILYRWLWDDSEKSRLKALLLQLLLRLWQIFFL